MSPSSSSDKARLKAEIGRVEIIKRDADGNLIERIIYDDDGEIILREKTDGDND